MQNKTGAKRQFFTSKEAAFFPAAHICLSLWKNLFKQKKKRKKEKKNEKKIM